MVRLQQIVQSLYKTVKHEQTGSQEATKITKSYQTISNESKNQKLQYKTNKHTIPQTFTHPWIINLLLPLHMNLNSNRLDFDTIIVIFEN